MNREEIKALKESLELSMELIDFVEECLKEIFGEEYSKQAIWRFEEDIEHWRYNGCLQSLATMKLNILPKEKKESNG